MKKIIIFSKNLHIGGMEKALVTLINSIDDRKYNVTLVLEKLEGSLVNKLNKNIKIINYNLSTRENVLIRKTINFIKKIRFIMKNYHKFDCSIDYATYSTFSSQMSRKCSKNSIIYIHSDYYNMYDGNICAVKNFFNKIGLTKFRKIIFVSKHSKDNIIKIMPEISNKAMVLGNLIDYKNIIEQSKEYKVDLDKNKINIVFVGRLEEHSKRISELIEAVNSNKNLDKFNLYIIGNGPNEKEYKELAKTNNIFFVGELNNPYPYIKACDYLILVSKYEGFPVVYNEATVLETKIITTVLVEDELIKYDENNVIELNSNINNFDDIINEILSKKDKFKDNKIDYNKINESKLNKLYKLIEV